MSLAIVIPAYKSQFFKETLESFNAQTNKNFKLYIGDDCSPSDLYSIVEPYFASLNIVYHRFEFNLGSKSLVKQWERCIDLAEDEEWIWLFSDDDLVDSKCVESFYKQSNSLFNLFHFNVRVVNGEGEVQKESLAPMPIMSSLVFLKYKLSFNLESFACEYIFKKKEFYEKKGFVEFPLGWCSDDATWALLGKESGIYTIPEAMVSWRKSEINISSDTSDYYYLKRDAILLFFKWMKDNFYDIDDSLLKSMVHFIYVNMANYNGPKSLIEVFYITFRLGYILKTNPIPILKLFLSTWIKKK